MMRSRVRGLICGALAVAAALAVPLGAAACGVLDGVFGAALLTDEELCARARALEAEHEADGCPAGAAGAAVLDCPMIECGRSNVVGDCAAPWDEFLACLIDDHDCDELGAGDGYCTALFEAFVTCGRDDVCDTRCAIDADCSAAGDEVCSGLNARFCAEAADDPSCAPAGARFTQCRNACTDDSECGGTTLLCVETGVGDDVPKRACEELRCVNSSECVVPGFVCAHPVTMQLDVPGFCLPTCDPFACFGDAPAASCTCNDTVTRCAPLRVGGLDVVGFACTMTGDRNRGEECAAEGDCGNDTACVNGTCHGYCDVVDADPDCAVDGVLRCEPLVGEFVGTCAPCVVDEDCAPGDDGQSLLCSTFNEDLCALDPENPSCIDLPPAPVCRERCTDSSSCGSGFVCADTDFTDVRLQACEPQRCSNPSNACAELAARCVDPANLRVSASDDEGGLCLTSCDPSVCANGLGESCECAGPTSRCAPLRAAGDSIVDFACTFPGPTPVAAICEFEADCAQGACVPGASDPVCRSFCDETTCAGTCESLGGPVDVDARVCVPN